MRLLVAFFVLALSGLSLAGPLAPKRLRLEYLQEPLGVDVLIPRFSWALEHTERNQSQSAYHILVGVVSDISLSRARSVAAIAESQGQSAFEALQRDANVSVAWDSGSVRSGQSTNVEYAGKELVSASVYVWTVSRIVNFLTVKNWIV